MVQTLNYAKPERRPVVPRAGWRAFVLYQIGLFFGTVPLCLVPNLNEAAIVAWPILAIIHSALLPIALFVQRLRFRDGLSSHHRWFALIVAVIFYPAAHGAMCKFMTMDSHRPEAYAVSISAFHYLPLWIVFCGVLAAVGWRAAPLGERQHHWLFAGFAAPISVFGLAQGIAMLGYSYSASRVKTLPIAAAIALSAMALCAVPTVIALTFSPLLLPEFDRSDGPLLRLDEAQKDEVAEHLSQFASSSDDANL